MSRFPLSISKKIANDLVANDISFVTTVPCKQLDANLKHTFMCNKPAAILTDASFRGGYR